MAAVPHFLHHSSKVQVTVRSARSQVRKIVTHSYTATTSPSTSPTARNPKVDNLAKSVAHGIAVQASIRSDDTSEKTQGLLLLGGSPLSLGLELAGGVMTVLIKRNTAVPTKKFNIFLTYFDSHPGVVFQEYDRELARMQDNHLLGKFGRLSGAPWCLPVGVIFNIAASDILNVSKAEIHVLYTVFNVS
ncbi:hypothetical protein EIP86_000546 [Pleurotus ostreatoroseus]|nr:hypothetical protein EIP86_000546 [Pleurotus ostreatoroseus]